jgi:DNA-directed RNA polymerase specialized sigma54-like protein
MEEKILKLMKSLDITREEALELMEEDREVDRMTKMSDIDNDISEEQKKAKKKYSNVKKGVNAYGKTTTRELKPDENKRLIISTIAKALEENGFENVEVTNIQKYITFKIGSEVFEIDLKRKRQSKK